MKVELICYDDFLDNINVKKEWNSFKKHIFYPFMYQKYRIFFAKSKGFNVDFKKYLEFLCKFIIKNITLQRYKIHYNSQIKRNLNIKSNCYIELIFVNDSEIKKINADYMGKDYATDVLSFPLDLLEINARQCFGSIILNLPLAKRKSRALKHNLYSEISLLFTHAFLHLLGFNHENRDDKGSQRMLENRILKALKLPASLIQRSLKKL